MSRKKKIFLGIISILPTLLCIFGLTAYIGACIAMASRVQLSAALQVITLFCIIIVPFIAAFLVAILSIISMIFLLMDASKNPRLTGNNKTLWIFILATVHGFAHPIYWYKYIWRDDSSTALKEKS
jgi:hypothetical protein